LDVGSGAGFPGLTLKIGFPALAVTLLEPVAKKRAFLKEVARACQLEAVEVRSEQLETFVRSQREPSFDAVTSRALGHYEKLVPTLLRCLKPEGGLFLWLTHEQGSDLAKIKGPVEWQSPLRIPLTEKGEIWQGIKKRSKARSESVPAVTPDLSD
jgi:16S rRNA (guanine527-N7)-methyltransferase